MLDTFNLTHTEDFFGREPKSQRRNLNRVIFVSYTRFAEGEQAAAVFAAERKMEAGDLIDGVCESR